MSRSGYDAVVDVDDEVSDDPSYYLHVYYLPLPNSGSVPPASIRTPGPAGSSQTPPTSTNILTSPTGRPRPYRPPRRPRIPQLQLRDQPPRRQRRLQHLKRLASPGNSRRLFILLRRRRETFSVDDILLRAVLRRGHLERIIPMLGSFIPPRQLPRRPRGKPRFIRPVLDRYNCGDDFVFGGNYR